MPIISNLSCLLNLLFNQSGENFFEIFSSDIEFCNDLVNRVSDFVLGSYRIFYGGICKYIVSQLSSFPYFAWCKLEFFVSILLCAFKSAIRHIMYCNYNYIHYNEFCQVFSCKFTQC